MVNTGDNVVSKLAPLRQVPFNFAWLTDKIIRSQYNMLPIRCHAFMNEVESS